jgi:hypothetical protein
MMEHSNYGKGFDQATYDMDEFGVAAAVANGEFLRTHESRLSMYVIGYRTAVSVRMERMAS